MRQPELALELNEDSSRGRYSVQLDGVQDDAELTFSKANAELVIADHTYVPAAMKEYGVGLALVERLVADAREKGFKVFALCPYEKAQFQRHEEWADIVA
jgi:predicted GNAT family acetyltransferase